MAKLVANGRLILSPFVTREQRLDFEEYAAAHIYDQVQEVLDYNNVTSRAADVFDVVEHIVYTDLTKEDRVLEPYEGEFSASILSTGKM